MQSEILEWIKVIGSILLSWPVIGLLAIILFRKPLLQILLQFTSSDVRKAKVGPVEIEREFKKLTEQGQQAVKNLNRINELMAESRLLELEITESMFGRVFTADQQERMRAQIQEFRKLTRNAQDKQVTDAGE
jgi:short subunit fatty acids transporter